LSRNGHCLAAAGVNGGWRATAVVKRSGVRRRRQDILRQNSPSFMTLSSVSLVRFSVSVHTSLVEAAAVAAARAT